MVLKQNGEAVDFSKVRPKYQKPPLSVNNFAIAASDAIWGNKTLAEKKLAFNVVRKSDTDRYSERMPDSQNDILKREHFLAYFAVVL